MRVMNARGIATPACGEGDECVMTGGRGRGVTKEKQCARMPSRVLTEDGRAHALDPLRLERLRQGALASRLAHCLGSSVSCVTFALSLTWWNAMGRNVLISVTMSCVPIQ